MGKEKNCWTVKITVNIKGSIQQMYLLDGYNYKSYVIDVEGVEDL